MSGSALPRSRSTTRHGGSRPRPAAASSTSSRGRSGRFDWRGDDLAAELFEQAGEPGWASRADDCTTGMPSRIEGIGRPRMEPGFLPSLPDLMFPVPDAASVAGARAVRNSTGLPVGGSTGTTLWGALHLAARMLQRGERGTIVTVVCDAADLAVLEGRPAPTRPTAWSG